MTPLLYVITTKTKDYGDKFVVRKHEGQRRDVVPLAVCESLDEARLAIVNACKKLPDGLEARMYGGTLFEKLDRIPADDAVIVESWGPSDYVRELRGIQRLFPDCRAVKR